MTIAAADPRWRAAAELERRRRLRASAEAKLARERSDFREWLPSASPDYDWSWRHLVLIADVLERVKRGELRFVIIEVPVRHGKSELGTVRFPVYCLDADPRFRTIIGCHTQKLAEKFSRKARRIARARGIRISEDRDTAAEWETEEGGGLRALGVGAAAAGVGANLVVVDDPHKNRADAESMTRRDAVWEWFRDDLFTRLEPQGAMIVTMSRWHPDDLVGRIKADPEIGAMFTVIRLPALAEPTAAEPDLLGREEGEALEPKRYDFRALIERRKVLGSYGFASLFQQRPRPREGGMFKWSWFRIIGEPPAGDGIRRVRSWDLAGTEPDKKRKGERHDPDYTSGALLSMTPRKRVCVEHVARGQWGLAEREAKIVATAQRDAALYGRTNVRILLEADAGVGGEERTAALVRALHGYPVFVRRPTTNKTARAEPFAAQAEAGNVDMVAGDWNTAVLTTLSDFPQGEHDDDVDSTSSAYNELAAMTDPARQMGEIPIQY